MLCWCIKSCFSSATQQSSDTADNVIIWRATEEFTNFVRLILAELDLPARFITSNQQSWYHSLHSGDAAIVRRQILL